MTKTSQTPVRNDEENRYEYFDDLYRVWHREDGPALIYDDGCEYYYQNGLLHREGGPAIDSYPQAICYCRYGKLHRMDGPAFHVNIGEKAETKHWYFNGSNVDHLVLSWAKEMMIKSCFL